MNGMEKEIIEVSLDDIIPNRFQPRLSFDEKGLNELAESIRQHGIIQPLVLRKISDKYEIIAGERRYKAAFIAGLNKVPAVIIDLNDNESAEVAIVENIQRRDLSPIEEAKSYKKLLDRGYLTQDQLAVRMGKTQATISNKLRLLNLDEKVQDALLNNRISERHARSLLKIEDKEEQKKLLDEIITKKLNVRDTEKLISNKLGKNDEFVQVSNLSNVLNNKEDTAFPEFINTENIDVQMPKMEQEEKIENNLDNFFNMPVSNSNDNIEALLNKYDNSNNKPIIDIKDDIIKDEKINPINDFMTQVDSNIKIDKKDDSDIEMIDESIPPFNSLEPFDIKIVIDKINNLINEINSLGFKVKLEEYDFENLYQFVIKVSRD